MPEKHQPAPQKPVRLRILFTSDVHGHLSGHDYFSDTPAPLQGLCRTATLIEDLRLADRCCLLLDGGDSLQGTPMTDWAAASRQKTPDAQNPVVSVMNSLKYDAAALGNHDFGYGLEFLKTAISQAEFPMLCANVQETATDTSLGCPTVLLDGALPGEPEELASIRIGLFGVLPPQVSEWEASRLSGQIRAGEIVEAAAKAARNLRAAGADLVIAISHSGISEAEDRDENASVDVADIEDVDIVLCGHTHQLFPGPDFARSARVDPVAGTLCGKPAIMPGHSGSHVGVMDLELHPQAGRWRISGHDVRNLAPSPDTLASPALTSLLTDAHAETLAFIRRPVGHLPHRLHSFFSAVTDDKSLRLVAEAQRRFVEGAVHDTADEAVPILSATAPLKAGGRGGANHYTDVPAGPVNKSGIHDLYCFANEIAAIRINGATLRDWLEMSAGWYCRIKAGAQNQPLLEKDFPAHNADVIHGVTYRIDLTQPARYSPKGNLVSPGANRITNLCWRGEPVTSDQVFIVATNTYRAHGGGRFPGLHEAEKIALPTREIREILSGHVHEGANLYGTFPPAWAFSPIPGTAALFESSCEAESLKDEMQALSLSVSGPSPNGGLELHRRF